MSYIQPLPQSFVLGYADKQGAITPSPEFIRYMQDMLRRVGGITGGSYNQIKITSDTAIWDVDNNPIVILLLTQNVTIPNPPSMIAGDLRLYRITLVQDATGGRTVTWGSDFKWPSGVAPTLSSAPNAVDELWFSTDGTNMKGLVGVKDIR